MMRLIIGKPGLAGLLAMVISAQSPGAETMHMFEEPSDDRWHYPFNFTPGFRPIGSCFGAAGIDLFNDRDGNIIVAWETGDELSADYIAAGLPPESYDIASITVTLTNHNVAEWPIDLTTDEWFTFGESGIDPDPGRPIELFGAGFGPTTHEDTWREDSFYSGSDSESNTPRDPFPFVFQEGTGDLIHVEDCVKGLHNEDLPTPLCNDPDGICPFTPVPWGIGVPQDYVPGDQDVPFDVKFDIDLTLSDGAVLEYFQNQLSNGRVIVIITSLREAEVMGAQSGFPSLFFREGVPLDPLAKAPSLHIRMRQDASGDSDGDGAVTLTDWGEMVDCVNGPNSTPGPSPPTTIEHCLCTFDFDEDEDVDFVDFSGFQIRFSG